MTDSLGAPDGGVPRHLFELDELQNEKALDAVVVNMPASGKRAKRHNGQDLHPAAARPPRKSTTTHGEGPVLLLSVEEAARSLSIGRSKTYELIAEGLLRRSTSDVPPGCRWPRSTTSSTAFGKWETITDGTAP